MATTNATAVKATILKKAAPAAKPDAPQPRFTDGLGRTWSLTITMGVFGPLRDLGLDLQPAMGNATGLEKVAEPLGDWETLAAVLWTLCEAQAAAAGIDEAGFAAGLDGPTLFAAGRAVLEAVVCFSQPPEVARMVLAQAPAEVAKMEAATAAAVEKAFADRAEHAEA